MANSKYMKLGVATLATVAIALGIGIGIGKKQKDNNNVTSSFKAKETDDLGSMYDIDCEERRILVVPGSEYYTAILPTEHRTLGRRLGKEAVETLSDMGPTEVSFSSKTSKSTEVEQTSTDVETKVVSSSSKTSKSEGTLIKMSKSSKGSISKSKPKRCTKSNKTKSKSSKCASTISRDSNFSVELDGPAERRKLRYEQNRELGKEAIPAPAQGGSTARTSNTSGSKSGKTKYSSNDKIMLKSPTICRNSDDSKDIASPAPQAATATLPSVFSRPLVPAASNIPAPSFDIPTTFPTSGGSQKGTSPDFETVTDSPTYSPSTPIPSNKPTTSSPIPFPPPEPIPPAPVTPFPTSPEPTTYPPTPEPTNPLTLGPSSIATIVIDIPTDAPSFGATPTVSTEMTGPPTKPDRDGLKS